VIAFYLTLMALVVVLLVRNELTFRMRSRRYDEIHAHNVRLIEMGGIPDLNAYDDMPSYEAMLFDVRRWTYRQFYPQAVA
jgi:hypothetical protein